MDFSDIMSICAVVISLTTAIAAGAHQIRWHKPVVMVTGKEGLIEQPLMGGPPQVAFNICITNTGCVPTQILFAAWEFECGERATTWKECTKLALPLTLKQNEQVDQDGRYDLDSIPIRQAKIRVRPFVKYTSRKLESTSYGKWATLEVPSLMAQQSLLRKIAANPPFQGDEHKGIDLS